MRTVLIEEQDMTWQVVKLWPIVSRQRSPRPRPWQLFRFARFASPPTYTMCASSGVRPSQQASTCHGRQAGRRPAAHAWGTLGEQAMRMHGVNHV